MKLEHTEAQLTSSVTQDSRIGVRSEGESERGASARRVGAGLNVG